MKKLLYILLLFSSLRSFGQDEEKYCYGNNCIVFSKVNGSDNEGKFTQLAEAGALSVWAIGSGFFNEADNGNTIYLTYDTTHLKTNFRMTEKKALNPDTIYIAWSDTTGHLRKGHVKFRDSAEAKVYDADYDLIIRIPVKELKSNKLILNGLFPFDLNWADMNYISIFANDPNYVHKFFLRQDILVRYKGGYFRGKGHPSVKGEFFKKV